MSFKLNIWFVMIAFLISGNAGLAFGGERIDGVAWLTNSGTLFVDGTEVTLFGLERLSVDASCGDEPDTWACGANANAAFASYISGRSLSCASRDQGSDAPSVTTCFAEGIDVGRWLILEGWARPIKSAPPRYRAAATEAKAKSRGVWQSGEGATNGWVGATSK